MSNIQLIGLGTDKYIEEYCNSREIPLFPFPIVKYEVRKANWGYIRYFDLYDLVDKAGLQNGGFKKIPVFVYGSSRFHHITHGLIKKIIDPNLESLLTENEPAGKTPDDYTTFIIDNHTDFRERTDVHGNGDMSYLHCGTHMRDTLQAKDTKCKTSHGLYLGCYEDGLILQRYGPNDDRWEEITEKEFEKIRKEGVINRIKNTCGIENRFEPKRLSEFPQLIDMISENSLQNVYLTIDIDVLSHEFVEIDSYEEYHQGRMHLEDLLTVVEKLLKSKKIIGIDICGMTPDPRACDVYDKLIDVIKRAA